MGRKPKAEGENQKSEKDLETISRLSSVDLYKILSQADVKKLSRMATKYGVSEEALIAVAIQALLEKRIEIATRNTVYLKPI